MTEQEDEAIEFMNEVLGMLDMFEINPALAIAVFEAIIESISNNQSLYSLEPISYSIN